MDLSGSRPRGGEGRDLRIQTDCEIRKEPTGKWTCRPVAKIEMHVFTKLSFFGTRD
jgi:hypothetical protein